MNCPICKSNNDLNNKFCIVCGTKISDFDFINNIDFVEQKSEATQNISKSIKIIGSSDVVISLEGDAIGRDESFNYKSNVGNGDTDTCPQCGKKKTEGEKFCSGCGMEF